MKMIFFLTYFAVACTLHKSVVGNCVAPDKYNNNRYYYRYNQPEQKYNIFCNNIIRISPNIIQCPDLKCKSVFFTMSNISTVPTNAFMEARSLNVIDLSNSGVRIIETGAFLGLLDLEEIHLEINDICKVTRGSFNSLISLRILNLSHNSIAEIESESFHGSSSIRHLDLSYNKLTSIPMNLIEPLTKLQSLNISNNLLLSMNSNLCSNLLQLRYLILDNNKIVEIDKCIDKLLINKLSFSKNHISNLGNISFPSTLISLKLDNNNLSELNGHSFKNLSELELIDLSKNSINNYSVDVFRDIEHVKVLNISNNHLNRFDSADFSRWQQLRLLFLDIKGNNISVLNRGMFQNLSNLEMLDISMNNISYIPLDVLSDLKNLKKLNISGNKIEYLESGVFNELSHLKILDISYNSLMNLKSHIFFPLVNLQILNINYNDLKSLQVTDIINHCATIKVMDIDGNKFSCSELARIFLSTKNSKFSFKKGNTTISENVNGIACSETASSSSEKNRFGNDYLTSFFDEDFKKSAFYEFFQNFSGYKQNTRKTNNNTFWDNNEDIRHSFQSFINEMSILIHKLKIKEDNEYTDANNTISTMNEFLKNQTISFHEFLRIFSEVSNDLESNYANTVSNISSLIKYKLSNNKSLEVEQNLSIENSSLSQFVEKLSLIGEKLGEQFSRNTNKLSNLTFILQKEMELFKKFGNTSFRNSVYELSKMESKFNDNRIHQSESSEAFVSLKTAKAEGRVTVLTGTKFVTPEIENLINALNTLKLFIILSILFLMAIFSVKIYKHVKTDYYQRKRNERSSLELPIMDK